MFRIVLISFCQVSHASFKNPGSATEGYLESGPEGEVFCRKFVYGGVAGHPVSPDPFKDTNSFPNLFISNAWLQFII